MSADISRLRPLDEFYVERPVLFPSAEALRWFIRVNKDELVAAGALTRPTGRWLIQPEAFDRVVLSIGSRRAQR